MAGYIVRMLSKAGHHAVEDMSKAQKHLYLISNRTSRKMVEEASKTETSSNIFLLGSSINQSESLKNATKTQFVDLRRLDAKNVEMLANSLSFTDAWRKQYALETAPTKFETFTVPTSVLVYRILAYFQVVGYLAGGLFDLFTGSLITAPFFLFLGVGIFFLVEYTLQRRIPLLIAMGVLAGFPLLLSVLYSLLMVVIFVILGATYEIPPQFLAIGGMSIFGISCLVIIPDVLVDVLLVSIFCTVCERRAWHGQKGQIQDLGTCVCSYNNHRLAGT